MAHDGSPIERIPLWVRVLLVVDIVIVLALLVLHEGASRHQDWFDRVWALAIAVPCIVVTIAAWARPRPAVRGATACIAVSIATGVLVFAGLMWSDDGETMSRLQRTRLEMMVFALANYAVFLWALVVTFRRSHQVLETLIGFVLTAKVPALAVLAAAWLGVPLDLLASRSERADRLDLVRDVIRVQRCAFAWADARADGAFPETLDALGPSGSGCLAAGEPPTSPDQSLRYEPVIEDGTAIGFRVHGRRAWGDRSSYSVVADEMGLLRDWHEDHPFDEDLRTDGIPRSLGRARDCIVRISSQGPLPATADALVRAEDALQREPVCESRVLRWMFDPSLPRDLDAVSFRFEYAVAGDGWRLQARPTRFAETALRSYLMTADNAVFVTLEDRSPTVDDWPLPACLPHDLGDCVPTPATDTPRVAFLHDSIGDREHIVRFSIRVEGDSSRVPTDIAWAFRCGEEALDPTPPAANAFRAQLADNSCWPRLRDTTAAEEAVPLRVWLRSKAGVITSQQGVIRILRDPLP